MFKYLSVLSLVVAGASAVATPSVCTNTHVQSYDGTCNNLANPAWGKVGSSYGRLVDSVYYEDCCGAIPRSEPSPRDISNHVFDQDCTKNSKRHINALTTFFGQMINHDSHATDLEDPNPIVVPAVSNDPWSLGSLTVRRMAHTEGTTSPRVPTVLSVTPYLDASCVYGSNAEWASDLRSYQDGLLKEARYEHGIFPPRDSEHLPAVEMETFDKPAVAAGDFRANENPGLFVNHIMFFRNHNLWARRLKNWYPDMTDEELYQQARSINRAEMQNIALYEFFPALTGEQLPAYEGYDENLEMKAFLEVTAAALRIGHTMVAPLFHRLAEHRSRIPCCGGPVDTSQSFFDSTLLTGEPCTGDCQLDPDGGFDGFVRGLINSHSQEIDSYIVDEIRNALFRNGGPPMDLALINLVRGRDVGLPTLNEVRRELGLPAHTSFADVSADKHVVYRLSLAYDNVEDIDLYVGGLAEDAPEGASLGVTFCKLLKKFFIHLRASDRFWFEHDYALNTDLRKHNSWKNYVYRTNMRDIIKRNTELNRIPLDAFFVRGEVDTQPEHPFGQQH